MESLNIIKLILKKRYLKFGDLAKPSQRISAKSSMASNYKTIV